MKKRIVGFLFFSFLPCGVNASEYGVNFYGSVLQVNDSVGDSKKTPLFSPFNVFYSDKIRIDSRYWVELSLINSQLNATDTEVGQDVAIYGFNSSYQKRFRLTRKFKPWLGAGISYLSVKSRLRHTVDQSNFLADEFPNLALNNIDLHFVGSNYWKFNNQWHIGAVASFTPAILGDVFLFNVGLSVSYF